MNPQRIISVVPSQTEFLLDLGLDQELVGITKYCIYPADKVKDKAIVKGTKDLDLEKIHALQPDLIIANKEENTRDQIEELQRQYTVHITDISTLPDALNMMLEVGTLVGKGPEAEAIVHSIQEQFNATDLGSIPQKSVAYFIWRKPYMVAANDTFIHAMLETAGFQNAFAGQSRYPEITADDLRTARPDLIFLSSEPYPFGQKHIAEFREICPEAEVMIVNGEMFSWYGSRLLQASDYFRNLRNEIFR